MKIRILNRLLEKLGLGPRNHRDQENSGRRNRFETFEWPNNIDLAVPPRRFTVSCADARIAARVRAQCIRLNQRQRRSDCTEENEKEGEDGSETIQVVKVRNVQEDINYVLGNEHEGKFCCKRDLENYPEGRGRVGIINVHNFARHEARAGSNKDIKTLKRCLEQHLDVDVAIKRDPKRDELLSWLQSEAETIRKGSYSYALLFIMSHGEKDDSILTADSQVVKLQSVREALRDANVPVVLFVNACRGRIFSVVLKTDGGGDGEFESATTPMGTMYSTQAAHTSFRNVVQGSLLVSSFCAALESEASRDEESVSLQALIHGIQRRMARETLGVVDDRYLLVQLPDYREGTLTKNILMPKKKRNA